MAYHQSMNLSDNVSVSASFGGWSAPQYAENWDDVVQITYARTNYAWNQAQRNTAQREYVTKREVGAIVDAYRKSRIKGLAPNYNPADKASFNSAIAAVQNQLGLFAVSQDKVGSILRQFYYGVFGNPQQIPPAWYMAGQNFATLTESQRDALKNNADSATKKPSDTPDECGILCSIYRSVSNVLSLPGDVASGVSTTARIMSIAIPVVLIGGTVWALWVVGRKVLELDTTDVVNTVGTRGLNKVASR